MDAAAVRAKLLAWYDASARHLPWRMNRDPYRIWVSEVMLQQTRTETVMRYYAPFLEAFPDIYALAEASEEDVLKKWEGLGYYRRARALREGAIWVMKEHGGVMPESYEGLLAVKGIGSYTAGAIASIAYGECVPAVDGNAVRVLSRVAGYDGLADTASGKRTLFELGLSLARGERPGDVNQAIMDLGSGICAPRPDCGRCPLQSLCACGDAQTACRLPLHREKKKPVTEEWMVHILIAGGRVAVCRRNTDLLKGLWVFPMTAAVQKTDDHDAVCRDGLGVPAESVLASHVAGHARHVFTHRIWEMELQVTKIRKEETDHVLRNLQGVTSPWRMVTLHEMNELPFPSAMRAAKALAGRELAGEEKTAGFPAASSDAGTQIPCDIKMSDVSLKA